MRYLYAFLIIFHSFTSWAQPQVEIVQVASGLGYIVDIAHAGDERMFILTRHGQIRIIENGIVLPTSYLDISSQVTTSGEMGSLGLAFDPDFQNNGRFYIHYNAQSGGWWSRISRFTAADPADNIVDPATEQILFEVSQPGTFHNGGDVDFGADEMLYMTLGDSFNSATAQDLTHPLGSIHRLDVSSGGDTYSIPVDNPYANSSGDTLKTIWAKGLRNPFRFGFDALTGDVWIGDVGSTVWEEVNLWPAGDHSGANFGWRCFEGFFPATSPTPGCGTADQYDLPVAVQPTSGSWCSVIGGRVYRGSNYPALYGRYLYSDYCAGVLYSLLPDGNGEWINELLASGLGNGTTCIGENNDLDVFIGKSGGTLHKITAEFSVPVNERTENAIKVFPVPAQEELMVQGDLSEGTMFRLIDAQGRTVLIEKATASPVALALQRIGNGCYTLLIKEPNTGLIQRHPVIVAR